MHNIKIYVIPQRQGGYKPIRIYDESVHIERNELIPYISDTLQLGNGMLAVDNYVRNAVARKIREHLKTSSFVKVEIIEQRPEDEIEEIA